MNTFGAFTLPQVLWSMTHVPFQQTQQPHGINLMDPVSAEALEVMSNSGSCSKGQTEDTCQPAHAKSSESKIVTFFYLTRKFGSEQQKYSRKRRENELTV